MAGVDPRVTGVKGAPGGDGYRMEAFLRIPELAEQAASVVRNGQGEKRWQRAVKRGLDVAVGLLILAIALIPMALVALAVRLDSPGPVFFAQDRLGRYGRRFRMCKFRSMQADAEALRPQLQAQNHAQPPLFKHPQDPRITRLGRWLRRYSLDELPQIFDVLRGEMSLVGPRPPLPEEVEEYTPRELGRLLVKPGMTGLWQVSDRRGHSFDAMVELDLRYVREWSLWLDLRIMLWTPLVMLRGWGAC